MEDHKFEPGAAKYGNFINYYQFNPPENRLSLMPSNILQLTKLNSTETILCLDIGCNTGELTAAIYSLLMKSSEECSNILNLSKERRIVIIGIDVDSTLIERANETNTNSNITYLCVNAMNEDCKTVLNSYLKLYNKEQFDLTFSYSITMWIHLNHGDDGLKRYLLNLSKFSDNIVIEPQPWKCYKNAMRRMKRCNCEQFNEFKKLLIRDKVETEISNILINICHFEKLFETTVTKWGRKISIYTNKAKNKDIL